MGRLEYPNTVWKEDGNGNAFTSFHYERIWLVQLWRDEIAELRVEIGEPGTPIPERSRITPILTGRREVG